MIARNKILRLPENPIEFAPLEKPISKIGKSSIFLNGKHFSQCSHSGFLKFTGRPITIFGIEREDEGVTRESVIAFGAPNGAAVKSIMIKCLKNPEKLVAAIRRQLK